jgi:uncharacterized SAM-binding protein YcdF (DUF218 family)
VLTGIFIKNKQKSRKLFIAAIIIFWVFSNTFLLNFFARQWDIRPVTLPDGKQYSCAIVMGGYVMDGGGKGYFAPSSDRFIQAVKLYKQAKVSHLFITGGSGRVINGTPFKYADWVAGELMTMGVPADAIITEDNSRNTLENAANTKQLLSERGLAPPYVVITSAFHMRRSLWTLRHAELDVVPYPCNYLAGITTPDFNNIWPSAGTLATWPVYIKEVVGLWVYQLKG